MGTILIKVNPRRPEQKSILKAAGIIKKGGLVAFPTETVYGLGADALNPLAVKRIFEAKGRPADNPLIIHVAEKDVVNTLCKDVPEEAYMLIDRYWPGPLTLVMRKSQEVPLIATGGLDTVALRMPSHPVALSLIAEAQTPVAAPSANVSGSPSPTTAGHVMEDLRGKIDAVLDGGPSNIGLESTVLDLSSRPPVILRPGWVTLEELSTILERPRVHPASVLSLEEGELKARSPGLKYRHYAPKAKLILVEGDVKKAVIKINGLTESYKKRGLKVGVLASEETQWDYSADVIKVLGSRSELEKVSKNLYGALRKLDEDGMDVIIAEGFRVEGLGLAILSRLRKGADEILQA